LDAEFKPPNDIQIGGRKISGSAQKRKSGVILQHGTIILELDREKMFGSLKTESRSESMTSLAEALGRMVSMDEIKTAITHGFESVLGKKAVSSELAENEKLAIDELIIEKYGNQDWNFKR